MGIALPMVTMISGMASGCVLLASIVMAILGIEGRCNVIGGKRGEWNGEGGGWRAVSLFVLGKDMEEKPLSVLRIHVHLWSMRS